MRLLAAGLVATLLLSACGEQAGVREPQAICGNGWGERGEHRRGAGAHAGEHRAVRAAHREQHSVADRPREQPAEVGGLRVGAPHDADLEWPRRRDGGEAGRGGVGAGVRALGA